MKNKWIAALALAGLLLTTGAYAESTPSETGAPVQAEAAAEPQHAAAPTSLLPSGADRLLDADGEKERAALLCALEEHRLDDVDRALLRRIVEKVLVHEGPRLEVVMR